MWGSVYLFEIASSVIKIKKNNNITEKPQCALFYTGDIFVLCCAPSETGPVEAT